MHERNRLQALRDLGVLDSAPEPMFDQLAQLASVACGAPVALLSLVDEDRQWFKANVGLEGVFETPRAESFCAHAIVGSGLFEVPDALLDARFADNPLVAGPRGLRHYAGAPVTHGGHNVGTLCVLGPEPRALSPEQASMLLSLAALASQALGLRRAAADRARAAAEFASRQVEEGDRFIQQIADSLPVGIAYTGRDLRFVFANLEHCRGLGRQREQVIGRTREEISGQLDPQTKAKIMAALDGREQRFEARDLTRGSERLIETRLVPDVALDGSVRGIYAASVDVTERSANERALRELTAILDNTPDFVVQTDRRGAISYMNPAALAFCGLGGLREAIGRNWSEFNDESTTAILLGHALPAVNERGLWVGEAPLARPGGGWTAASHIVIGHRGADGRVERYSAIIRDISQAASAHAALEAREATLRAVLEAIPAAIAVAGPDGNARLVNQAYERWTGVDRGCAVGHPLAETFGPPGDDSRRWISKALAGESGSYERGIGGRHMAGSYFPLRSPSGAPDGFVAVAQDITERKREEVRLLQLAERDPLTGLLNRGGFDQAAQRLLAEGLGERLGLLCIDLDHFKPVNDEHGHAVGDEVLREFSRRMEALVRPTDSVARLGGDEFAILLPGIGRHSARALAERVVQAASEPFLVDGLELRVGASVGAAFGADEDGGWHELLVRADAKLYEAKGAGRGRSAGF